MAIGKVVPAVLVEMVTTASPVHVAVLDDTEVAPAFAKVVGMVVIISVVFTCMSSSGCSVTFRVVVVAKRVTTFSLSSFAGGNLSFVPPVLVGGSSGIRVSPISLFSDFRSNASVVARQISIAAVAPVLPVFIGV